MSGDHGKAGKLSVAGKLSMLEICRFKSFVSAATPLRTEHLIGLCYRPIAPAPLFMPFPTHERQPIHLNPMAAFLDALW